MLDEATDKWGAKATRVELQRIEPPGDVTEAMHRQMKAERDRRAMILEAEGSKGAAILQAEGIKEANVRRAEGEAQATRTVADAEKYRRLTVAAGEAEAIQTVYKAIHDGRPTTDLITIKYLETMGQMANGQATKMFIPYEAAGLLSSVAAIGEMLKEKSTTPPAR